MATKQEEKTTEKVTEKATRKAPQRLPYELEINATRILKEIPEIAKIKAAVITLPGSGILETVFGNSIDHDKKILRTLFFGHSKPVTKNGKTVQTFNLAGNGEKLQAIFDAIPTSELNKRATGSIKATSDKILRGLITQGKVIGLTIEQVVSMAKSALPIEDVVMIETEVKNAFDDTVVEVKETVITSKQENIIKEVVKTEESEEIPSESADVLANEQEELDGMNETTSGDCAGTEVGEALTDEPSDW